MDKNKSKYFILLFCLSLFIGSAQGTKKYWIQLCYSLLILVTCFSPVTGKAQTPPPELSHEYFIGQMMSQTTDFLTLSKQADDYYIP